MRYKKATLLLAAGVLIHTALGLSQAEINDDLKRVEKTGTNQSPPCTKGDVFRVLGKWRNMSDKTFKDISAETDLSANTLMNPPTIVITNDSVLRPNGEFTGRWDIKIDKCEPFTLTVDISAEELANIELTGFISLLQLPEVPLDEIEIPNLAGIIKDTQPPEEPYDPKCLVEVLVGEPQLTCSISVYDQIVVELKLSAIEIGATGNTVHDVTVVVTNPTTNESGSASFSIKFGP